MLKSIEIWDFESHEHTLVENLSEGLSVIFGVSNAGKTSIIRALRLAAYNEFDPKSLRVGAKKCKVRVTTDRGVVQVTRGPKDNLWEVWHGDGSGPATHTLEYPGKAVVPQAAEVIGLSVVKLGDIPVPVNIMDQLESHFMLSGVGDKNATGSVRAQIIDELSGLSGIEGIIKDVSLDNHRAGREIKQSEKQMAEIQEQLHDEKALEQEDRVLGEAEKHLAEYQDSLDAAESAEALLSEHDGLETQIRGVQTRLNAIPDTKAAEQHLDAVKDASDVIEAAGEMRSRAVDAQQDVDRLTKAVAAVPDHRKASGHVDKADTVIGKARAATELLDAVERTQADIDAGEIRLREVTEAAKVMKHLEAAGDAIERVTQAKAMVISVTAHDGDVANLERRLSDNQQELAKALTEQDRLLKEIRVCPLNPSHPVTQDCLEGLRQPVIEETA